MAVVTKAANAHTAVLNSGWATPSNAFATSGDNSYATALSVKNASVTGDFGFPAFTTSDIPDGSLIDSVVLTVEWGMTAAVTGGTLGCFGRLNTGGRQLGPETTQTSTTEAQATVTLQGVTLNDLRTAGELLARIRCSKGNTTNAMTGNLDFVSVAVTYTAGPTTIVPAAITKLEGTGVSVSGSVGATAGNALFCGADGYTSNVTGSLNSVTRSTDTFTIDAQGDTSASAVRQRIGIASAPNVAGGAQTATVTFSSQAQQVVAFFVEAANLPASSMLSGTPPAVATGNSASGASNALTNADADAIYVGIVGSEATAAVSTLRHGTGWYDTYGGTWSGEQDGSAWPVCSLEFQVVSSAASRQATWTLTSANWGALVAAYRYAGPAFDPSVLPLNPLPPHQESLTVVGY